MTSPRLVERIRAQIGWEAPARTELVEAGHVRRSCQGELWGEDPDGNRTKLGTGAVELP